MLVSVFPCWTKLVLRQCWKVCAFSFCIMIAPHPIYVMKWKVVNCLLLCSFALLCFLIIKSFYKCIRLCECSLSVQICWSNHLPMICIHFGRGNIHVMWHICVHFMYNSTSLPDPWHVLATSEHHSRLLVIAWMFKRAFCHMTYGCHLWWEFTTNLSRSMSNMKTHGLYFHCTISPQRSAFWHLTGFTKLFFLM